jgi:hypothetical protein
MLPYPPTNSVQSTLRVQKEPGICRTLSPVTYLLRPTYSAPCVQSAYPADLTSNGWNHVVAKVGHSGLEPETFPLSEECSSRLS